MRPGSGTGPVALVAGLRHSDLAAGGGGRVVEAFDFAHACVSVCLLSRFICFWSPTKQPPFRVLPLNIENRYEFCKLYT